MGLSKKSIFKFCIFGIFTLLLIPQVYAEEVDVGYVTNNTEVLMDIPSSGAGAPINLPVNTANSYGNIFQLWFNVSNLSISPDYTYQLELRTPNASITNITSMQVLANNGQICNSIGASDLNNGYPKFYFSCSSSASYISIYIYNNTGSINPITTAQNFRWNYAYLRYYTEDDDIDLGPVISNQQQNTQDIINNQNQLLGSKCPNLFNKTTLTMGDYTGGYSTIRASSRQSVYLEAGTYIFKTDLPLSTYQVGIDILPNAPPSSSYNSTQNIGYITSNSKTFTVNTAGYFVLTFKKGSNSTFSLSEINTYNYQLVKGNSAGNFCAFGSYTSKLDDVSGAVNGVTDAITDDDVGTSTSDAANFITGFNTNTFGLTSIVTAPLNLIQSLTSSTCSPLELPLPYMNNKKLTLPCMTTIYSTYFGSLFTLYQTITYGVIAYWVIVRIFNQVKDFKNPEHDEIEVVDL